ncbi:Endonuclease MutS2 [Vibrio stylophorae]|uniref:Ribosome rescue factor SmrB n=1 Tax=Vibrio stylophorae TaxID=659351 RepID=A0ABN8DT35_9VIBR|nr:endonuclease SmrB [Vibrio stylophorae]CAH0533990.1 Endonuclease MutS2 [Vibrio stylophorae]
MSDKTTDDFAMDDSQLFSDAMKGVKKIAQDTIKHAPTRKISNLATSKRQQSEQRNDAFYFSDEFEPHLSEDGPMRYARDDVSKYEVKRLRRGIYVPDIYLDMHGMTQLEAKRELAAMIAECRKEGIRCASVMHGIGTHVLKQKAPLWLAQHPDVMAFHQAPLEFGGAGALLVLIEVNER